jgi:hypothetical protein
VSLEEAYAMNSIWYEIMAEERLEEARSLYKAVNRPDAPARPSAKPETRPGLDDRSPNWGWYRSISRFLWAE